MQYKTYLKEQRKKFLIGAGVAMALAAGGFAAYRFAGQATVNKVLNESLWAADDLIGSQAARQIGVSQHIRNLPAGWKPSARKVEEAATLGIRLGEGQTIVDQFTRTIAA